MAVIWGPNLIKTGARYQNGKNLVTRTYQTKADTELEAQTAAIAVTAPSGMIVADASTDYADEKTSRTVWLTEVSYGYGDTEQANPNPTSRPAVVSYGAETWTEDYFEDSTGAKVINAAGAPYESMPQRQRSCLVVTVSKNISAGSFDPLTLVNITDTTNSSAKTIKGITYPAGTLLMSAPTAQEQYEGVYHYYAVTYTMKANADGWTHKVMECGYHELVAGKWKPILDELGNEVSSGVRCNARSTDDLHSRILGTVCTGGLCMPRRGDHRHRYAAAMERAMGRHSHDRTIRSSH